MTDEATFLARIIADPDSDEPRLEYADWLEEQGQTERSEFIRVQCDLAKVETGNGTVALAMSASGKQLEERNARATALRRRERELRTALGYGTNCRYYPASARNDYDYCRCELARGFVFSINCEWNFWLTHHAAILAAAPVTSVTLTTMPEMERRGVAEEWPQDREAILRLISLEWPRIRKWNLPQPAMSGIGGTVTVNGQTMRIDRWEMRAQ